MKYKKISKCSLILLFFLLSVSLMFSSEQKGKPGIKENTRTTYPIFYSQGVKTTYFDFNSQEMVGKSEVKQGKIYFYNNKFKLERTGIIRGDTVLYDNGKVKREKIRSNKIYQYDENNKLISKIWVRPNEIKRVLSNGNIEKFKIKINR